MDCQLCAGNHLRYGISPESSIFPCIFCVLCNELAFILLNHKRTPCLNSDHGQFLHPCISVGLEEECHPCIVPSFRSHQLHNQSF